MAVVELYEIDADRGGSIDDQFLREYDRQHIAICNSKFDREVEILLHPKCPKPGVSISDWDGLARCTKVDFKFRPHSRWRWLIKSSWSTKQTEPTKGQNPLDDDPEIEVNTEVVSKERYTDRNGKPYTNTAGDIIKVVRRVPQVTISVTRNISIYSGWIQNIAGVINSTAIRIKGVLYPAYTLTIAKVRIGKTEYRANTPYMVCQLELAFDEEGWVQPYLNQGFNELVPDPAAKKKKNGKVALIKQRCLNDYGEPEANPVFLDKNGMRPREKYEENGIIKSRPKQILDPSDIVILKLDQMDLLDFNKLPVK